MSRKISFFFEKGESIMCPVIILFLFFSLHFVVLRYQHEDTKRKIIRLEQCARSSMQRAIAYQNAFAVLYGRHLKQYIKKTEVWSSSFDLLYFVLDSL